MGIHALWTVLWLVFGIVGYFVSTFAGLVWAQWHVANSDRTGRNASCWPIILTPVCWMIGIGWGVFALVQAILEFIQAVTAAGALLPG